MVSKGKKKLKKLKNNHSFRRTRRFFLKLLPMQIIKTSVLGQQQVRIILLLF